MTARRKRRFGGSSEPATPAWPAPRRSLARRVTYGVIFVWLSLAGHLVLIYGSRRGGAPAPGSPLAPFVLDVARADEDPIARWIGSQLNSLLRVDPVQPIATPPAPAAPIGSATAAPVATASPAPATTAGVFDPSRKELGERP